jgi:hypothetical protein
MVSVAGGIFMGGPICVPQSRQKRAVSGFSVWHFGHLVAMRSAEG